MLHLQFYHVISSLSLHRMKKSQHATVQLHAATLSRKKQTNMTIITIFGASLVLHVPALRRRKTEVVRYIVKMYLAQHSAEPVVFAERLCRLKNHILFH